MVAVPYIITTWHNEDAAPTPVIPKPKDTRIAVATLDEARGIAIRDSAFACCPNVKAADNARRKALSLPESGGTIGPLPDGTIIEVERINWIRLAEMASYIGSLEGKYWPHIITVYNHGRN